MSLCITSQRNRSLSNYVYDRQPYNTVIKNDTNNVPLHKDQKSFNLIIFCNELDKKLGKLVSNNLSLNHAIFNSVFDKFVARITK